MRPRSRARSPIRRAELLHRFVERPRHRRRARRRRSRGEDGVRSPRAVALRLVRDGRDAAAQPARHEKARPPEPASAIASADQRRREDVPSCWRMSVSGSATRTNAMSPRARPEPRRTACRCRAWRCSAVPGRCRLARAATISGRVGVVFHRRHALRAVPPSRRARGRRAATNVTRAPMSAPIRSASAIQRRRSDGRHPRSTAPLTRRAARRPAAPRRSASARCARRSAGASRRGERCSARRRASARVTCGRQRGEEELEL